MREKRLVWYYYKHLVCADEVHTEHQSFIIDFPCTHTKTKTLHCKSNLVAACLLVALLELNFFCCLLVVDVLAPSA